jgi:hypothetical protein
MRSVKRSVKISDKCDANLEVLKVLAFRKFKTKLFKGQILHMGLCALSEKWGLKGDKQDEK